MSVIKVQFTLRIDPITHAKVRKMAKKEKRSMNNMVECLIQEGITRYEEKNGELEVSDEDIYIE